MTDRNSAQDLFPEEWEKYVLRLALMGWEADNGSTAAPPVMVVLSTAIEDKESIEGGIDSAFVRDISNAIALGLAATKYDSPKTWPNWQLGFLEFADQLDAIPKGRRPVGYYLLLSQMTRFNEDDAYGMAWYCRLSGKRSLRERANRGEVIAFRPRPGLLLERIPSEERQNFCRYAIMPFELGRERPIGRGSTSGAFRQTSSDFLGLPVLSAKLAAQASAEPEVASLDTSSIDSIALLYLDACAFNVKEFSDDAFEYIYDGLLRRAMARKAELFDAKHWAMGMSSHYPVADMIPLGIKLTEIASAKVIEDGIPDHTS